MHWKLVVYTYHIVYMFVYKKEHTLYIKLALHDHLLKFMAILGALLVKY